MPLWESNEIYFVAGLSVLVTLGVFASLAYFVYKRSVANGRRADEEQAALEKVLLRKEVVSTYRSPPTKPLIVSPSFSSPNKVPARHLRSGSYSPTHYLSPYHSRQPRRNSSPTSNVAAIQQPKLPQIQLYHPQLQEEENQSYQQTHLSEESGNVTATRSQVSPVGNNGSSNENEISIPSTKTNNENESQEHEHQQNNNNKMKGNNGNRNNVPGSLAHHNSQYYGTIPPRRVGRHGVVAPAESNLVVSSAANTVGTFLPLKCGSGSVIIPHLKHNSFIKSEYVQLPGKDGGDFAEEGNWKCKDDSSSTGTEKMNKWKNCSDADDGSLRRKLLLQKQYQQKLQLHQQQQHQSHQHRLSTEPPGELFKMKHTVSEEIPYYISTQ